MRVAAIAFSIGLTALAFAQTPHFAPPVAGEGPREVAGFELGQSISQTRRTCRRANRRFVHGAPVSVCDGVARELGFDAKVRLRECNDSLCEVTLVLDDSSDAAYRQMLGALRRAYGSEVASQPRRHRHFWSVEGSEVELRHQSRGHGLRVTFQSPARVLELSRTSD